MELKEWLKNKWRYDNHNKYQKYFEEWFSQLTLYQHIGFKKQMYNDLNNVLRHK